MKKIGILTFHKSYNCGSMMQTFALQTTIKKLGGNPEIIDFSNEGQKKLYQVMFPNNSIKNVVKNIILYPHKKRIQDNNEKYEEFIKNYFELSKGKFSSIDELSEENYSTIIAGSDQIWNITIDDADDAYFLSWVKKAKKIAYAPSFGAKNIMEHTNNIAKYKAFLNDFDFISIRENNGKKWIKDLIDKDVPVVLDPTLLLDENEYSVLIKNQLTLPEKFIFYYSPHYENEINTLVENISKKLNMPVIGFNSKTFYVKMMNLKGFKLPDFEDPSIYLELIKKSEIVITTSFHGTIFSSIFKKKFWVVKNGGMLKSDDRVQTLATDLDLLDRVISIKYDDSFDYNKEKNYDKYNKLLSKKRIQSMDYLEKALLKGESDENSK